MYTENRKNKRGTGSQFSVPIFRDTDARVTTKRFGELQFGVPQFWDTESLYKQVFRQAGGPCPKIAGHPNHCLGGTCVPRCRISKKRDALIIFPLVRPVSDRMMTIGAH